MNRYWKVLVDDRFKTKIKELSIIGGYPISLGEYPNGEEVKWFFKSNYGKYIYIRVSNEGWGWITDTDNNKAIYKELEYCGEYFSRLEKLQKLNKKWKVVRKY